MEDYNVNEMMEETEKLPFFNRVLMMFTEPTRAFDSMKTSPKVLGAYLLVIALLIAPLFIGFIDGSTKETMISAFDQTGQEFTDDMLNMTIIMGLVGGIIGVGLIPLIQGFIYHIVAMIQSKTGFKKTLSIILHASIITSCGALLSSLISKIAGMTFMFSPAMFLDPMTTSNTLYVIASTLNLFTIWSLFIIFTGFRSLHEMNKKEAMIATIAPTVFFLLISILLSTVLN